MTAMAKYCRDYLNQEESNDVLTLNYIVGMIDNMLKNSYDFYKKEELTSLKYVKSYCDKFLLNLMKRVSKKEVDRLDKRNKRFSFKLIDDPMLKIIEGKIDKHMEEVRMPRDLFDKFCEEVMDVRCNNCTKNHCECELYDVFIKNNAVEPDGFDLDNCRYAYSKDFINKMKSIVKGGDK